ncbi:MAG: HNH endonuclease [Deltaproteobacteria bacterium]|nr:MAG: HNH endonuclease [Deltaproteobacteria bacterium]
MDFDAPSDREIRRERAKAQALRKTRWWQQKTASGRCFYCNKVVPYREITMDHLLPISRGGRSTKENLVPSCKSCNSLKKSMMPLEWEAYCGTLAKTGAD